MSFPRSVQGDCKSRGVLYDTGDFSWYLFIATDAVALPILLSCSQLACDVPREPLRCGACRACRAHFPASPLGAGRGWS